MITRYLDRALVNALDWKDGQKARFNRLSASLKCYKSNSIMSWNHYTGKKGEMSIKGNGDKKSGDKGPRLAIFLVES